MRKIIFILLTVVFFSSCSNEEIDNIKLDSNLKTYSEFKVTQDELVTNVTEFLDEFYSSNNQTRNKSKNKIKSINILTENDFLQLGRTRSSSDLKVDSLLYIVNLDEGFIIAGADKRTLPIFAIIDEGNFSKDILKNGDDELFLAYIERTLSRINEDITDNKLYSEDAVSTRAYPIKEKIFPLLGQTKWGQRSPYNLYNPKGTTFTGCVMTALAQVSSHYKSPKSANYGTNIPENPLGKGFVLTLDWDKILSTSNKGNGAMPPSLNSFTEGAYNETQALALYMRYIGFIVDADYSSTSTGAKPERAIAYMRNQIGLQATDQHQFNGKNIYNQIKGGNLVVLFGWANSYGNMKRDGHAWIADGIFVSNHNRYYIHYNWGWNGEFNGFYFDDRWEPGRSEFNDDGSEKGQAGNGENYKYGLKASYISW